MWRPSGDLVTKRDNRRALASDEDQGVARGDRDASSRGFAGVHLRVLRALDAAQHYTGHERVEVERDRSDAAVDQHDPALEATDERVAGTGVQVQRVEPDRALLPAAEEDQTRPGIIGRGDERK